MRTEAKTVIDHLLIIEDNRDERALIVETMRPHCGKLHEADSLSSAQASILEHKPDAVMLDLILPDSRDPLHTLATIRLATQSAIVVVSSIGDSRIIAEGIKSGASGWFVKGDWLNLPYEVMRAYSQHRHEKVISKIETDFLEKRQS